MEMSLIELERELSAALPTRTLMSRRHGRRGGTSANNGSVANGNSTTQNINNSQLAAATGANVALTGTGTGMTMPMPEGVGLGPLSLNGALVVQAGLNQNNNSNTQF